MWIRKSKKRRQKNRLQLRPRFESLESRMMMACDVGVVDATPFIAAGEVDGRAAVLGSEFEQRDTCPGSIVRTGGVEVVARGSSSGESGVLRPNLGSRAPAAGLASLSTDAARRLDSGSSSESIVMTGGVEVVGGTSPERVIKTGGIEVEVATSPERVIKTGGIEVEVATSPERVIKTGGIEVEVATSPERVIKTGGIEVEVATTPERVIMTGGIEVGVAASPETAVTAGVSRLTP